jgi:hypothetical protein
MRTAISACTSRAAQNGHILINDLRIGSQIQDDLYQVWLQSQRRLLPIVIHRDEEWRNAWRPSSRSANTAAIHWRQKRS